MASHRKNKEKKKKKERKKKRQEPFLQLLVYWEKTRHIKCYPQSLAFKYSVDGSFKDHPCHPNYLTCLSHQQPVWKAERNCKSHLVHISCLHLLLVPTLASGMDVSFEIVREREVAAWQPTYKVYVHLRWEMLGFSVFGWLILLCITCAQENTDCGMPECAEWLPSPPSAKFLLRNLAHEAMGGIRRLTQWCFHVCSGSISAQLRVKWNETCFLINFHCLIGDEIHWKHWL